MNINEMSSIVVISCTVMLFEHIVIELYKKIL